MNLLSGSCQGWVSSGFWKKSLILMFVGLVWFPGWLHPATPDKLTQPHVPVAGGLGGKTCYECHIRGSGIILPSQERPRKYSVASAWVTYLKSPHGRLRAMGDDKAPACEDCHMTQVWSEILPQSHPDSPIHPNHLPAICARCHGKGMLSAKVAEGSMHLELHPASLLPGKPLEVRYGFLPGIMRLESAYKLGPFNVVAVVYFFFLVLTVTTLTAVSTYMVLDCYRKLVDRGFFKGNSKEKLQETEAQARNEIEEQDKPS